MITAFQSIIVIILYFGVLYAISYFTSKGAGNKEFFNAGKGGKWYLVAFGMIGASLSGVTFLSVPGLVEGDSMAYMQVVFGYLLGYVVVAHLLLPVYYKLNLTTIYTYLESRFGEKSYLTGAWFFILARTIGACFRLFLVAKVFQYLIFDPLGVPFVFNVALTILLIWVYTLKGGIKTIIWTDTLQTAFMLLGAGACIYAIVSHMDLSFAEAWGVLEEKGYTKIFFTEDSSDKKYFVNQILSGAFITIAMTGLDQDMMQKNLTCKNLKDAQKNVWSLSLALIPVNLLFLFLGGVLTVFAHQNNIETGGDGLFSSVANSGILPGFVGITFLLGLVAAAYSSADSALTSLTTSFCVDILKVKGDSEEDVKKRKWVHVGMSGALFVLISLAYLIDDNSVLKQLFTFAGYTYGPLLGMFSYGLLTKRKVLDKGMPIACLIAPILSFGIFYFLKEKEIIDLGFFVLILNGFISFILIHILSLILEKNDNEITEKTETISI